MPRLPSGPRRPPAIPHTPGYVEAKELPDGAVPPANADGNFIIGPTHNPAPEMTRAATACRRARSINFTMKSTDSKIYPGIAREPGTFGTPDPNDPAKLIVTTSHPAPYTRTRRRLRSQAVRARHRRAVHRRRRRPDQLLFTALDNLIAAAARARR